VEAGAKVGKIYLSARAINIKEGRVVLVSK